MAKSGQVAQTILVDPDTLVLDAEFAGRAQLPSPETAADMARKLEADGQLQPIGAVASPSQPGKYRVIYGFTRSAALQMRKRGNDKLKIVANPNVRAEVRVIEVTPDVFKDREKRLALFKRTIHENKDRNETNAVDDAHNYVMLRDTFKLTDVAAATILRCSSAWCGVLGKVAKLPGDVKQMIIDGDISARTAVDHDMGNMSQADREYVREEIAKAQKLVDGERKVKFPEGHNGAGTKASKGKGSAKGGSQKVSRAAKAALKQVGKGKGGAAASGKSVADIRRFWGEVYGNNKLHAAVRNLARAQLDWISGTKKDGNLLGAIEALLNTKVGSEGAKVPGATVQRQPETANA